MSAFSLGRALSTWPLIAFARLHVQKAPCALTAHCWRVQIATDTADCRTLHTRRNTTPPPIYNTEGAHFKQATIEISLTIHLTIKFNEVPPYFYENLIYEIRFIKIALCFPT